MKQTKEINGINLRYEKHGGGDEIYFLLHGNGESSAIFRDFCKRQNLSGTVYAPDTRGHGESDWGEPFTIKQFAEDFAEFIRDENLFGVTVIGYSDGANIAMNLALLCPERLKRCVLISGNILRSGLSRGFSASCAVLNALMKPFACITSVKRRRALNRLMLTDVGLTFDDLKNITVPCEIYCAGKDVIRFSHTEKIAETLGVTPTVVEGATHFDILEKIKIKQ